MLILWSIVCICFGIITSKSFLELLWQRPFGQQVLNIYQLALYQKCLLTSRLETQSLPFQKVLEVLILSSPSPTSDNSANLGETEILLDINMAKGVLYSWLNLPHVCIPKGASTHDGHAAMGLTVSADLEESISFHQNKKKKFIFIFTLCHFLNRNMYNTYINTVLEKALSLHREKSWAS